MKERRQFKLGHGYLHQGKTVLYHGSYTNGEIRFMDMTGEILLMSTEDSLTMKKACDLVPGFRYRSKHEEHGEEMIKTSENGVFQKLNGKLVNPGWGEAIPVAPLMKKEGVRR